MRVLFALIFVSLWAGPAAAETLPATAPSVESPDEQVREESADEDLWEEDWLVEEDPAQRDPWEPVNRVSFGFNELVYTWLANPLASGYARAVPAPARRSLRRFFDNLREPVTAVNLLLQRRPLQAGATLSRFAVNSTIGLAGLWDPATRWGLETRETSFGETLASYGVGAGPYVVLPVLGPSSARDAVGHGIDSLLRIDRLLFSPAGQLLLGSGQGLSTYEPRRVQLDAFREASLDFYAAMRGAYVLSRDH